MQLYSQASLPGAEYPIGEEVIMLDSTRYGETNMNPRNTVGRIIEARGSSYAVAWSSGHENNGYILGLDIGFTAQNVLCINKVKYKII